MDEMDGEMDGKMDEMDGEMVWMRWMRWIRGCPGSISANISRISESLSG